MSIITEFQTIISDLKGDVKCSTNISCSPKARECDICKELVKSFLNLSHRNTLKTICTGCKIHVVNANAEALFRRHLYNGLKQKTQNACEETSCETCCTSVEKAKKMTSHVLKKELSVCESCMEQLCKENPYFFTCTPFNKT